MLPTIAQTKGIVSLAGANEVSIEPKAVIIHWPVLLNCWRSVELAEIFNWNLHSWGSECFIVSFFWRSAGLAVCTSFHWHFTAISLHSSLLVAALSGCHRAVSVMWSLMSHNDTTVLCSVLYSVFYCVLQQFSVGQYSRVQCSLGQYSTVLVCTVQCSTVQYSAVLYRTTEYDAVQRNAEQCSTVHRIAQNKTVWCFKVCYGITGWRFTADLSPPNHYWVLLSILLQPTSELPGLWSYRPYLSLAELNWAAYFHMNFQVSFLFVNIL